MPNTKPHIVLLVEDDKFLSKIYQTKLSKEGLEFRSALDGEGVLEATKTSKPSVIVLDLILPKKNGFEVLAELKAASETKDIPVIVLSNLGQDTDVKKAMEMGAVDYIVKANISIEGVVEKIKKYV